MQNYRVQGRLGLRFARSDTKTILHVTEQATPLKVIRAFELESGGALVHLHNVSGGVLGGDRLDYHVELEAGTHAQLTTTSATRVYRHRYGAPHSVQHTTVQVGEGALLEILPDPVIPYAGSAYQQETRITLGAKAGLFWWETITPGRTARGETFAYDSLTLLSEIYVGDRPIAIERAHLQPGQRPMDSPLRLGHDLCFTTFYICKTDVPPAAWLSLEAELRVLALSLSESDAVRWGCSTLSAHGLAIRGLATHSRFLTAGLVAFWDTAKRSLYGCPAVPPRKIY
jgi:urease accessory protein